MDAFTFLQNKLPFLWGVTVVTPHNPQKIYNALFPTHPKPKVSLNGRQMAIFIKKMVTGQRLTRWFVLRVHHSRDVIGRILGQKNALPWRHEGHYCHVDRLRQRCVFFVSLFQRSVGRSSFNSWSVGTITFFGGLFVCVTLLLWLFFQKKWVLLRWMYIPFKFKLMCFMFVFAVQWIVVLSLMTLEL